jgi:hypothetical protein
LVLFFFCSRRRDLKKAKNIFFCSFVFEKNLSGGGRVLRKFVVVFIFQLRRPSPPAQKTQ